MHRTTDSILLVLAAAAGASAQSAVWRPLGVTSGNIYYNGGNVGIGTTNPAYPLDLAGALRVKSAVAGTWSLIDLEKNNDTGGALVRYLPAGAVATPTNRYFYAGVSGATNRFDIFTYDGTSLSPAYVSILNTGNVGIGTSNPNPQYALAVNGVIGAKEVIVTLSGWSDYVLRPDYRLRPLSEVNAYIKEHGHLPDIPSEAEVKSKGVSVGDMQARLLAKIEELTLHMIRLEGQNRELKERIGQLEAGR